MRLDAIKPGTRVRIDRLESTSGMLISPPYLKARREGAIGVIKGSVPKHADEVFWVEHEGDLKIAAYRYSELEPYDGPTETPHVELDRDGDSIFD